MQLFLSFILTFYCTVTFGQNFDYPSIKSKAPTITELVSAGWTILDSSYGDMNKDGIKDAAIIIQRQDKVLLVNSLEDTVLTQPRILLIFFKKPDGTLVLKEQSNLSF